MASRDGRSTGTVGMISKLPDVGTTIFTVMSRRARELGALNLGQGFPDYDIDPRLTELVAEAMRQGFNQYAPMEGAVSLREAIATKLQLYYGLARDPQLVPQPEGTQGPRHAAHLLG